MNEKVLIADDKEEAALLLQSKLQASGYRVDICGTGKEALEKIGQDRPDIVLMDIMMPVMNGFDACRLLKAQPETKDLHVIMVSALHEVDDKIKGLDCGADDYISKPYRDVELLAKIRAHLRNKNLHDELKKNYIELSRLEGLKNELTQFIVHDLRNPLTTMIGWLSLLKNAGKGTLNEEQTNVANLIAVACNAELEMINDLLDITTLEEDSMAIKREDNEVLSLVDFCVEQVKVITKARGITIDRNVAAEVPRISADGRMIRRVLSNLLGNASRFAPKNGTVTLNVRHEPEDGGHVFSVSDTGPGIPEQHLARVFDKFYRVEYKGSHGRGLGLAFCKLAVEAHGGRIWADNIPGAGARFTFTIPLAPKPMFF